MVARRGRCTTRRIVCALLGSPWLVFAWWLALIVLLLLLRLWLPALFDAVVLALALLGLFLLLLCLARWAARWCRTRIAGPKGSGIRPTGPPRRRIPSHTYKRPDPLIYSQYFLAAQGQAVTWDNPDIELYLGSAAVPSHSLAPNTTHQIRAHIWNGSLEAPAANLLVRFYYLQFGIGTTRNYIGQTFVNLPVKGASGLPAVATMDWKTPSEGHYCVQVELVWPDDANPLNNLGQENIDVKKFNSPRAVFELPVRNDWPEPRLLRLQVDSYRLPELPPCPPEPETEDGGPTPHMAMALLRTDSESAHAPAARAATPDLEVRLLPEAELRLGPNETRTVTVEVTAQQEGLALRPVNINAFAGSELVGGVTLYVQG